MSVETRPTDNVTPNNLLIGMPFVEFAVRVGGVLQPYEGVGIIDSAELAKELETVALESSQSGVRVTVRELPTRVNPQLNLGVFSFAAAILRYTLGSATKTAIPANAAAAINNERISSTLDPLDFLDLANRDLNAGSVNITPGTITAENLGTGDGTKGAVSGDYKLAYKVRAVSDIPGTVDVTSAAGVVTSYAPVAVGGAGVGLKVTVVVGTASDSGNLQFFNGAAPVNVTGTITVTYTPSFVLTEGLGIGTLTAVAAAQSDDGGVFLNETVDANSAAVNDVTLTPAVPVANDAFYVGATAPFDRVRVVVSTAGVGQTIVWEYHNGTTWVALTAVTDKSVGFTVAGTADITFDVPSDWRAIAVNSVGPFFYVRARVSGVTAPTGATGTQIWTSLSDDYVMDLKGGRVRLATDADKSAGHRPLIARQPVDVDYTYRRRGHTDIQPFTQLSFSGKARIRQLTDVGINLVWEVPSAQILVTSDSVGFADDDFTVGNLTLKLLDDPTLRFGTMSVYSESEAAGL